jgi:hypothetical protein
LKVDWISLISAKIEAQVVFSGCGGRVVVTKRDALGSCSGLVTWLTKDAGVAGLHHIGLGLEALP